MGFASEQVFDSGPVSKSDACSSKTFAAKHTFNVLATGVAADLAAVVAAVDSTGAVASYADATLAADGTMIHVMCEGFRERHREIGVDMACLRIYRHLKEASRAIAKVRGLGCR